MLSKKINLLCSGLVVCSALFSASTFSVAAATADFSLNIDGQSYSGTYTGDLDNDIPSGDGTFSVSATENEFTISGTWKKGKLNGSIQITNSDGSYTTCHYSEDKPYGRILKYNANDKLIGYDFYYQMRTVSSLKEKSVDANYNLLLGTTFPDAPQKITGTVSAVFSTASNAFVILIDDQNHPYVLTYVNNSTNKFNQGIIPNLKIGEHITAYGYLQKQSTLDSLDNSLGRSVLISDVTSDLNILSASELTDELNSFTDNSEIVYNELSTNTLPFILVFAADVANNASFNIQNPSMDYSDITNNPYLYSNLSYTLTGTVQKAIANYAKGYVQMLISEEDTANLFYVKYRYSDGSSLPATGDNVTVDGLLNGNYKKIIPSENAELITTAPADNSKDSSENDSTSIDSNTEAIDEFIDEDVADEYEDYDDISYVILYPRITTTSVTINK